MSQDYYVLATGDAEEHEAESSKEAVFILSDFDVKDSFQEVCFHYIACFDSGLVIILLK
jgi:hypothetical protein